MTYNVFGGTLNLAQLNSVIKKVKKGQSAKNYNILHFLGGNIRGCVQIPATLLSLGLHQIKTVQIPEL